MGINRGLILVLPLSFIVIGEIRNVKLTATTKKKNSTLHQYLIKTPLEIALGQTSFQSKPPVFKNRRCES
jgi:hypothetical protein